MASKKKTSSLDLSRRERQIMQAVYRNGPSTIAQILELIPDPPTADSIRRMCHILAEKGHLKSTAEGNRRLYKPTVARNKASRSALSDVMDTFFAGSPQRLMAALLDTHSDQLSAEDIDRLNAMIDQEDGE